ncbi:MAG: class II aldolase/adducin family protein [Bacteroidota bacterium]
MDEGYIKFRLHWEEAPLVAGINYDDLMENRQLMYQHHLIGWDADLGVGYGNISKRFGKDSSEFIISGTQTGGKEKLTISDFCLVTDFAAAANQLWCRGPIKASSESMTHAAIYTLGKKYQAVIHIHNSKMWEYYFDRVPTTDPQAAYGTPEMARAIIELGKKGFNRETPLVVMGGHQDGILAFGNNLSEVSHSILSHLDALP